MADFDVQEVEFDCPKCEESGVARVTEFSVSGAAHPHRIEIIDHDEKCSVDSGNIAVQLGLCENKNHHKLNVRRSIEPALAGRNQVLHCRSCKTEYDLR